MPWLVAALIVALLVSAAPAAAVQPSIISESVSGVTETSAILEASVDPGDEGSGAVVQLQIAADPAQLWPEITCPEPPKNGPDVACVGPYLAMEGPPLASIARRPGDLPTWRFWDPELAVVDLAKAGVTLAPSTTYFYRALVSQGLGVDAFGWRSPPTYGPTESFRTPPGEQTGLSPTVVPPPTADPPASASRRKSLCKQRKKRRALAVGWLHCRHRVR